MNSTIAVALIASISTLAGASISGYITLLASRAQGKNQLLLANADRVDQQLAMKRQIRRDAYVQYLNQLSKVEQAFNDVWQSTPTEPTAVADLIAPITSELSALQQLINLVVLEGSTDVSSAATKLQVKLTLETVEVVDAARESKGCALCIQDDQKYLKLMMERASMKAEVIEAAQEDLKDAVPSGSH